LCLGPCIGRYHRSGKYVRGAHLQQMAAAYQKSGGAKVNYQGIGSSGGIKQIIANTVDFAGSDAPMKDDELAKDGLFQFPTVVGGVIPVCQPPRIKAGDLTLSGEVLGNIYLGKIKKWNDPAIAGLNPNLKLPGYGHRGGTSCRWVRHQLHLDALFCLRSIRNGRARSEKARR